MNILLVEDDQSLAKALHKALQHEGFAVNIVGSGRQALQALAPQPPDIVILDLGLPDIDGLQVLQSIRKTLPQLPVLILTARSGLEDKVDGLDLGADDYLAKPFELPELLARLRVLQRRRGLSNSNKIIVGDVTLDTSGLTVTYQGQDLELPRREFMLLKALMENSGKIQTRESLENKLYSWGEEVASNALEVHIHYLRKKLGADFIKTVRGVGYTVKNS